MPATDSEHGSSTSLSSPGACSVLAVHGSPDSHRGERAAYRGLVFCPNCQRFEIPVSRRRLGSETATLTILLLLSGCLLTCCMFPFLATYCLETVYECPSCAAPMDP